MEIARVLICTRVRFSEGEQYVRLGLLPGCQIVPSTAWRHICELDPCHSPVEGTQNPKSRAKLWMMGPIFDWIIDGQLQLVGGIVMIGSLYLPSFLLLPGHVHDWPIFITI